MSASHSVFGVAVLLFQLWGTHCFPTSACPIPCLCQRGPVLNCSSLGLTKTPTWIPENAVSLNISNNSLRSLAPFSFGHVNLKGLQHLWVGNNDLERLSLILERDRTGTRTLSSGEQECSSWAPDLQLLSAERNHLKRLPKGLGCMKSLQVLQLSYNQISEIGLSDLDNCSHLKELHLQYNRITSIHPQTFKDLQQLKVLDLSYNMLVTVPVPAYQSLRNLNALVDVSFNRWRCDCNLQTLRKWIGFDTEMGDASWQVVCASPPHHAGKDLLQLNDLDLTCPTHEHSKSGHYHNMLVQEGTQISIPCRNDSQDDMQVRWWTPNGQAKENQPGLLIKDITQQDAGLYICVAGVQGEHISVFDLHVYKQGSGSRLRRETSVILDKQENSSSPFNNPIVRVASRTESEFVLAVCLSVIITFILAFILGILLRPLLDKLWRRIRSKRQSTSSPTSSTEPQPYVNEGYCDVEHHEREVRVGSRVTFGGITEVEDQMPYYVTVEDDQADGSSESNTEADGLYEVVEDKTSITGGKQQALELEKHRGRADSSSSSLQEGEVNALVINGQKLQPSLSEDTQFEPIPDETDIRESKRRGSSSASSHSSQEDDSAEQSVDPVQIPGFTQEPFSEWPVRLTEQNVDDVDPELWNDSGESFSFNEDSERSSIRDLSNSALGHPLKDDDKWRQGKVESPSINNDSDAAHLGKEVLVDDGKQFELSDIESSCSSSQSGDSVGGPNSYIVNPELEEESEITFSETMPSAGILIRQETITLEPSDIRLTLTHGESVDEGMLTDDSSMNSEYVNIPDKFGIFADVDLDTVPKVKRYVEFKQSKPDSDSSTLPSFSPSSQKKNILSETEVKPEASFEDNRHLMQVEVSPDTIQKVKRYIDFKQSEPHTPTLPSPPSLIKKDAMLETKGYSSSSDDDAQLTTKDDNFFRTTVIPSDEVLKVKRYISFKQFDTSSPTKTETTTVQSMQPSSSPTDLNQNGKEQINFTQHEHRSSSLPSSPTSTRRFLSGKKLKHKKRNDQSFYGSHESLPLYHVHPSYRSSINKLNRGYDTDRSYSSEEEDQFMEYPRQLEITTAPGLIGGPITPGKNKDNVLNIDFDNSSSSTDVLEKKRSKGLMRLRALGARLFNKHDNETDERMSPVGWDAGRPANKQSKLSKEQTTNEDILFGKSLSLDHIPKVKRYIQFSHSYPQDQVSSPPPTTGTVIPDFKETTESRSSSFSSENETFVGHVDATYDKFPKVKRYIAFSHTEQVIQPESSTSSEDDTKPIEDNFFRKIGVSLDTVPNVKRYIQFNQPKPYSPTQTFISSKRPAVEVEASSSTSENWGQIDLNPVPKVKRYVQFKPHSSTLPPVSSSSIKVTPEMEVKTEAKIDKSPGDQGYLIQTAVSPENIQKVKRYIHFKQNTPSSPSITKKDAILETRRYSSSSEDDAELTPKEDNFFTKIGVSSDGFSKVRRYIAFKKSEPSSPSLSVSSPLPKIEAPTEAVKSAVTSTSKDDFTKISLDRVPRVKRYIQFKQPGSDLSVVPLPNTSDIVHVIPEMINKSETRRSSTSSEDEVKKTAEEDHVYEQTGAYLDSVPRVKRYIQFTYPAMHEQNILHEEVKIPVVDKESTSKEEDVTPSTKETDEYLVQIPKVKRYIQFTQAEPYSSNLSPVPPSSIVKEKAARESTSSDDVHDDSGFGQIGVSLNGVPRVKRYIQFTQYPAQTNLSSERRWSTSSEEDVKPSTVDIVKEKDEFLTQIPKVKRYIRFAQSEPSFSDPGTVKSTKVTETILKQPATRESTSSNHDVQDDFGFGQIGVSLDGVPRVKRYLAFTHPETSTALPDERVNVSLTGKEPIHHTSSEEKVTTSTNKDIAGETDEYLVKIPKVKRYIKFTQSEPSSSDLFPVPSPDTVESTKVTETILKQPATRESTSSDDIQDDFGFGQIGVSLDGVPRVKRYIAFTHPETSTALSDKSANVSLKGKEPIHHTSSEEKVTTSTNKDIAGETDEYLVKIPKVKRYINFTQSEQSSSDLFPVPSPDTVESTKVTETILKQPATRESTSSNDIQDDFGFEQIGVSLDGVPRVKRYIQFINPEHQSLTQSTTPISVPDTRRSSTSSEEDVTLTTKAFGYPGAYLDKIPKVTRYIQFTNSEPSTHLSTEVVQETRSTSSEDKVKPSTHVGNVERGGYFDKIPKVKRYIKFTQSEPSSGLPPFPNSSPVKSKEVSDTGSSSLLDPSPKEDNVFGQTEAHFDVPRVKRYIQFTQFPDKPTTTLPDNSVALSKVTLETSKLTTSPKNEVSFMAKEASRAPLDEIPKVKRYIQFTNPEHQTAERVSASVVKKETRIPYTSSDAIKQTGDKIPKVKRYIEFKQFEPYSSAKTQLPSSSVSKSIKETATKDGVQPAANANKIESMTQRTASDNFNIVPKVKRYIQFTPAESHPSTAVLAERVGISEEPRLLSTSSKYVKTPATDYIFRETDESLANIPKVKRYIEFTQAEPYSSTVSSFLPSTSLSSEPSRPVSKKKGSALIIKTESESWTSDQTGLKSSSLSSVGDQIADEPPAVPITSPPPLEQEDARGYLRENSEVRQRQERRRLLQQRRREMDEFNTESLSSMQQEGDKRDRSLTDYGGATDRRTTEGAEAPALRGLKTKSLSTLGPKSPTNKEFLI